MTLPFPKNAERPAQAGMFHKGWPIDCLFTAPGEPPGITQLKIPNDI